MRRYLNGNDLPAYINLRFTHEADNSVIKYRHVCVTGGIESLSLAFPRWDLDKALRNIITIVQLVLSKNANTNRASFLSVQLVERTSTHINVGDHDQERYPHLVSSPTPSGFSVTTI